MEQDTPTNRDLALALYAGALAGDGADERLGAVRRTFEKLQWHLSRRLGSGGYQALLKRALALAAADLPWLADLSVAEDGGLEGFGPASPALPGGEAAEGGVAILAHLIGLLDTFIGRALCLRVLHTVWSDAARSDTQGLRGDDHG